jgi:hypothetical protein
LRQSSLSKPMADNTPAVAINSETPISGGRDGKFYGSGTTNCCRIGLESCRQSPRCWPGATRPHPDPPRAPRRRETPVEEGSIQSNVDRTGSWRAARPGNRSGRSLVTKAALGGRAIRRAVTQLNPEQASKVELWTPTGWRDREGCTGGEGIDRCTLAVHRGSGDGTPERCFGQRGRSRLAEVVLQRPLGSAGREVGQDRSTVEAG